MSRQINIEQLKNIAKGATLLGSSGGGPISLAKKWIDELTTFEARIIKLDEIDPTSYIVVVAYMGSPAKAMNLDGRDDSAVLATTKIKEFIEESCGNRLAALMPIETGGVNSIVPLLVSNQMDIPVLDLDCAGRSVPTLPCTTFSGAKFPASPAVLAKKITENNKLLARLAEDSELSVSLDVGEDANMLQELAGPILSSSIFGSVGALTAWAIPAQNLLCTKNSYVPGTLTLSEEIGAHLVFPSEATCVNRPGSCLDEIKKILNDAGLINNTFATGKLKSYNSETVNSLDLIEAIFDTNVGEIVIKAKNESLIAWNRGKSSPLVIAPDSICYLGSNCAPYSNPDLSTLDTQVACGLISAEHREFIFGCARNAESLNFNLIAIKARNELTIWSSVMKTFAEVLDKYTGGYAGPYESIS